MSRTGAERAGTESATPQPRKPRIRLWLDRAQDPQRNAEAEERLFRAVEAGGSEDLLRLWVNSECLVRGKAMNRKYGWYNEESAAELGVKVVVRSTGGGVVYHDGGNLNWSFFFRNNGTFPSPTAMFQRGSSYVVDALSSLGVPACFSPPNRIDVEGRKISGMAARSTPRTLLVHGTLLLRTDLARLNMLCVPPPGCPPVANLSDWVPGISAEKVVGALEAALLSAGYEVEEGSPLPDALPGGTR